MTFLLLNIHNKLAWNNLKQQWVWFGQVGVMCAQTHTHTHTLYKIALLNPAMILNPYTPECIYVMR